MLEPAIGGLIKKAGTRYALVIATAKRARELSEDETINTSKVKTVSLAVKEIAEGVVDIIAK